MDTLLAALSAMVEASRLHGHTGRLTRGDAVELLATAIGANDLAPGTASKFFDPSLEGWTSPVDRAHILLDELIAAGFMREVFLAVEDPQTKTLIPHVAWIVFGAGEKKEALALTN